MQSSEPLPKRVGRYEVTRLLGAGAMGRVLLAHDPVLGREVAIKMLRSDLHRDEALRTSMLARMRHEAQAAARVSHPHIVTLHDLTEDDHLGICLVFEYVAGPTLKTRIEQGPLTPVEVARLARGIGQALSVAHQAGVLHRDVKPENIIMAQYGAKIADFGIARVPDSTLTRAGALLGTPAYSAPECISEGAFSPASDQFSLAATLYEAISGTRAFPGDDAVTVAARIGTEPARSIAKLVGLEPTVDRVLQAALAKDRTLRFASCEAFGEALAQALVPGGRDDSRRASFAFPKAFYVTERPWKTWLSAAFAGLAMGVIGTATLVPILRADPVSAPDSEGSLKLSHTPSSAPRAGVSKVGPHPAEHHVRSKAEPAAMTPGPGASSSPHPARPDPTTGDAGSSAEPSRTDAAVAEAGTQPGEADAAEQ